VIVAVTVNGEPRKLALAGHESLLFALRETLQLTGSKDGCLEGRCGSCTVLLDGDPVCACLLPAVQADGHAVETIEGAGERAPAARIQAALAEAGAVQCGFCTPGMVMSGVALLERVPAPSVADVHEALSGNLCRCTGYVRIVEALRRAAV
jgi:carbon-monoxide dehydrogenase small subunit